MSNQLNVVKFFETFAKIIAEREKVEKIVCEEMEGAAKLSIPLTAECGVGKNWLEAH